MPSLITYRFIISPVFSQEEWLKLLFNPIEQQLVTATSLALRIHPNKSTATISFNSKPASLLKLDNDDKSIVWDKKFKEVGTQLAFQFRIDTNFHGLTPLNTTPDDNAVTFVSLNVNKFIN